MKVKQLIEKLQLFNPEAEVSVKTLYKERVDFSLIWIGFEGPDEKKTMHVSLCAEHPIGMATPEQFAMWRDGGC